MRNPGKGSANQGIILIDQFFTVPQIGEVIRDLLILQRLSKVIEKVSKPQSQETIQEEDQSRVEVLKVLDPALV